MSDIAQIAASALAFHATRLAVAASNLVNAQVSAPAEADGTARAAAYVPRDVTGVSLSTGGVAPRITARDPASHVVSDAASPTGFAAVPNVDVTREMVTLAIAASSYEAAAKLLALAKALDQGLLDTIA